MDKEKTMEEKNPDTDRKQEQLTWLENLQRNSWEPEVIISGITLAFLFVFPAKIYEFCAYLNQDVGVGYFFSFFLIFYLTGIISVFKIFFVVHICLRFIWTGLLGLSYAFPQGAINERLFKVDQSYNYQKPSDMVLRLEKICSITFAYPISLVITFLVITIYLSLLIGVYVWFDLNFFVIYLVFMGSLLVFAGMMLAKSKLKTWYGESMISSINAIYQSNLGKWFSLGYGVCIIVLAIPVILSDVKDFSLFANERGLNDFEEEWPAKNHHYMDQHDPAKRFPRGFIPKEEISDNFLRVGIARYVDDHQVIEDLNRDFKVTLDSLGWEKIEISADLYRVYLNDSLVQVDKWAKNRLAVSGQKAYQAGVDISNLKNGIHEIRIEKLLLVHGFFDDQPEIRLREDWSAFTFVKK
jgi:hypothetical protein